MGKQTTVEKRDMGKLGRFMRSIEPVALVALPIVMLIWAWLRLPNAALVTSACAIVALVPFFVSFEAERRKARDIMPIIVMTALAVAGRLIFAPVPAIKPVTALVIITGLCFGRDEGFITGALTMLVSNMPLAPEPMLESRSTGAVWPVASIITAPDAMPTSRTRKTFTPAMPPTRTSTYGTT